MEIKMYHGFSWHFCHVLSHCQKKNKSNLMLFSLSRNYTLFLRYSLMESGLNLFSYLREKAMTLHCAWMFAKYRHEFMQQSHSIIEIHQQAVLLRRVPHNCYGKEAISSLQHLSIRAQVVALDQKWGLDIKISIGILWRVVCGGLWTTSSVCL